MAPAQNLDRRLTGSQNLLAQNPSPLLSWTQKGSQSVNSSLGIGSYGPPYTLTLDVSSPFTLSGPDTSLALTSLSSLSSNTSSNITTLIFTTADGFPYPLRHVSLTDGHEPGHPGRIWTNQSTSSHEPVPITLPAKLRVETDVVNGSRVWINNEFAGRFEVFVFGGRNTLFSWSQMALVAPLGSLQGGVDELVLEAGVGTGMAQQGNGSNVEPPFAGSAGRPDAFNMGILIVAVSIGLVLAVL
jgi:hexosaminidase